MKLFNLAIASIVDANTGYGVNRRFIEQFASATSDYERRAREIRAKSLLALIGKINASFKQYIEDFKAGAQVRRDTTAILEMSDHALQDIGLTHSDLRDLRSGQITLDTLGSRRELNRSRELGVQLRQSSNTVKNKVLDIQSANQEKYESKKCA